ncbi:MAG TPA: hypothetical protein VHN20_03790 [Beijerinckiaceae bacterium]|nr:hypothetical protein [Beijerinckiaceae bacterium]
MSPLSRRSFLLGTAALAGLGLAPPAFAQAAPSYFSSVEVDVRPLHARGAGAYADYLGAVLLAETRRAFADRIGRGGPRLVVRVNSVSLSSYSGGGGGRFRGGTFHSDYLDGEALIVDRRGTILARYPQLSAAPAHAVGAWYDPQLDQKRTVALAQHYASWLRRTLGV